jgi:hypothetical protein
LTKTFSSGRNSGISAPLRYPFAFLPTTHSHRENGYITHPIPIPITKNKNNDHPTYRNRSPALRRLKNPNATEITTANITIA